MNLPIHLTGQLWQDGGDRLRYYMFIVASALLCMLYAMPLLAQTGLAQSGQDAANLIANNCVTTLTTAGGCHDASGQPLYEGFLGRLMCTVQTLMRVLATIMYCKVSTLMIGPIQILLTIYVAVLGVQFATGMLQASGAEFAKQLVKVALVLGFATNADLAINILYNFFTGIVTGGADLVLGGTLAGIAGAGGGFYDHVSNNGVSVGFLTFAGQMDGYTGSDIGRLFEDNGRRDASAPHYRLVSVGFNCNLVFFLLFLLLFAPMVGGVLIWFILTYIVIFAKAAIGYVYSLIIIVLLTVFSPIFLCCALFQSTDKFFQQWLRELLSNALTIVLIFAFLVFYVQLNLFGFVSQIYDLLRPYHWSAFSIGPISIIGFDTCTMCQTRMVDITAGSSIVDNDFSFTNQKPVCIDDTALPTNNLGMAAPDGATPDQLEGATGLLDNAGFLGWALNNAFGYAVIGWVTMAFFNELPQLAKRIAGAGLGSSFGGMQAMPSLGGAGMSVMGTGALAGFAGSFMGHYDRTRSLKTSELSMLPRAKNPFLTSGMDDYNRLRQARISSQQDFRLQTHRMEDAGSTMKELFRFGIGAGVQRTSYALRQSFIYSGLGNERSTEISERYMREAVLRGINDKRSAARERNDALTQELEDMQEQLDLARDNDQEKARYQERIDNINREKAALAKSVRADDDTYRMMTQREDNSRIRTFLSQEEAQEYQRSLSKFFPVKMAQNFVNRFDKLTYGDSTPGSAGNRGGITGTLASKFERVIDGSYDRDTPWGILNSAFLQTFERQDQEGA